MRARSKTKTASPNKKQPRRKLPKTPEADQAPEVRRVLSSEDDERILENVLDQDPERA